MTEAQEEFVGRMNLIKQEIIEASEELDGIEGHEPGGESAVSAALAAIDAAIQVEAEARPRDLDN